MKKKINLSLNCSKIIRRRKEIKYVVIHYTGMQSEIESINRLKNTRLKVSCHYLINRKGLITQLVMENKVAWHAGKSKWKKLNNLNSCSIGIELVNKGHQWGYENFSNLQIKTLINLCLNLKKKYKIKNENFLGHSDIAPLRKLDPGEKFPWKKLSNFGIGTWYKGKIKNVKIQKSRRSDLFFKNLKKIGYRYFSLRKRTRKDKMVVKAFQRRYYSHKVNGLIDQKILNISHFLANKQKLS